MEINRSLPAGLGDVGVDIATRRGLEPALAAATLPMAASAPVGDWQRYLVAIARHKWFVILVTVVGTLVGVIASRFIPPQYGSRAILWFETASQQRNDRNPDVISGEEVVGAPGWVELVTSNTVLDSVVRRLRLYLKPESPTDSLALEDFQVRDAVAPGRYRVTVDRHGRAFQLAIDDKEVIQRGTVGDSIGAGLGFQWAPGPDVLKPNTQVVFEVTAPYDVATGLAKRLKPRMDGGGTFLTIQLRGKSPVLTAATVNAVAERMVVVAAQLKRQKFEALANILGGQYDHAKSKLDSAENVLRSFQTRTAGQLGSRLFAAVPGAPRPDLTQDPMLLQPLGLRLGLDQMRRDRRAIEDVLRAAPRTGLQVDGLAALESVQKSPRMMEALTALTRKQADLRDLRVHYTDESAPVQLLRMQIDSLQGTVIPGLARDLMTELSSRETSSSPRVDSAMGQLRRVPSLSLEEARLERDVASAEELATTVRQRYEAASLALVSSLPDVRILDAAVIPQRPALSLAPLLVVMAFVTSLGLAVLGILVRDGVDPKVRYPEQVTRGLHLPILGAVPNVGSRSGLADVMGPAIEALRGLRLRVLHSHGGSGSLLLTITSPAMGEGKSFVSANLALSFADAGYKTLLIDGDVRRGTQHIVLGAKQRPGLTEVLAGTTGVEEAVKETEYVGLSLLASGARMHRAPELLLSRKLKEAVERLKGSYDVIIVDSPPLAAGADPLILATVTRNLMLVMRSGTTDLPLAISKLEVLDTLPVRTIGVVLNDVRDGGAFKYYTYDTTGYALPRAGATVGGGTTDEGPHILVREDEQP